MKVSDKLRQHINCCELVKASTTLEDNVLRCRPCAYALYISNNFVRDYLRHCKTDLHKSNCGWYLEKEHVTGNLFRTCQVKGPLSKFLSSNTISSLASAQERTTEMVDVPLDNEMEQQIIDIVCQHVQHLISKM